VRLAGLLREGGGDRQEGRAAFGKRAVERREAQVVADAEAEATPRQVCRDRDLARTIVTRLAIAFAAREIDVEHVDLVVARDDLALRIDQQRTVHRLVWRHLERQRAGMDPQAVCTRGLAEGR